MSPATGRLGVTHGVDRIGLLDTVLAVVYAPVEGELAGRIPLGGTAAPAGAWLCI